MDPRVNEFKRRLVDAGIDKACRTVGLDFEEVFVRPAEGKADNPYLKYYWAAVPHPEVTVIINAVPSTAAAAGFPWEEWLLYEGSFYHNLLYRERQTPEDEEWKGEADDKEHPEQVLGIQWYGHPDESLIPLRLR